jgi:hypothetical protein
LLRPWPHAAARRTIEVVPVGDVSYVELLVPNHCGGNCPGAITPPGYVSLPANLFEVPMAAEVWSATLSDGVAGFRLTNDTDEVQSLPLIAAIGYNRADQPIAVALLENIEIKPGQDDYWRLKLSPASTVATDGTRPPDGEYRVLAWDTSIETLPSCIVIEHGPDRIAIGPEADNDCDEVPTRPECAPWVHLAAGRPGTIGTANCTRHQVLDNNVQVCLAAGPMCSEPSPSTGCDPISEDYCLTAPLCECPPWDVACLKMKLGDPANPYLDCIVPVDASNVPCSNPTYFAGVDIAPYFGASMAAMCESVRLHELAATIGPFDNRADFEASTFTIKSFNQPCKVDIEFSGTSADTAYALASLDLDNDKHIVLPVVIRSETPCGITPQCMVRPVTYDTALACAQVAPPNPGPCAPAVGSGCPGPMCGNECCGYGEQCGTNNECTCGNVVAIGGPACQQPFQCSADAIGAGCGSTCCDSTPGGFPQCDF